MEALLVVAGIAVGAFFMLDIMARSRANRDRDRLAQQPPRRPDE